MAGTQKIAIYPGSFDPITMGHIDILERALKVFDKVIIVVARNREKNPLFTIEERVELVKKALKESALTKVEVQLYKGLIVHCAKSIGAKYIIRGLRAVSDFDYEFQIATLNRHMAHDVDSVFFMTDKEFFYLSSSMMKDLARNGEPLKGFVPKCVEKALRGKYKKE